MEVKGIKMIGTFRGQAGYSESIRGYFKALYEQGYNITILDYGKNYNIVDDYYQEKFKECENKQIDYNVCIINLNPDQAFQIGEYEKFYNKGKQKGIKYIIITTWEMETLPELWIDKINIFDLCIVPSKFNYDNFKEQIGTDLEQIEHVIDKDKFDNIKYSRDDRIFKFYSIGQWQERKNFRDLIIAYLLEFENYENTELVIKTWKNSYSVKEFQEIMQEIVSIKNSMNLKYYSNIRIIDRVYSDEEIKQFHKECHCYVTATKGEGFCLPIYDALYSNNVAIATNFSAYVDDLPKEWLCKYNKTPVLGMNQIDSNYNALMEWATIDISDLRKKMRKVYKDYKKEVKKLESFDKDKFTYQTIGKKFKAVLENMRG